MDGKSEGATALALEMLPQVESKERLVAGPGSALDCHLAKEAKAFRTSTMKVALLHRNKEKLGLQAIRAV